MEIIGTIFHEGFYRPIFNLLIVLYRFIPGHDFGVAIIVLTLLMRLLLHPLTAKSLRAQRGLQALQPKIKELQEKYKQDRAKQTEALMGLYREHKISPLSGFIPILVQLPILFALFRALTQVFNSEISKTLYSFVPSPTEFNPVFLGLVNLKTPNLIFAILAGVFSYVQLKWAMPKQPPQKDARPEMAALMSKQMQFFMPLFTVFIAARFPAGLALYWIFTTISTIGEQYWVSRKKRASQETGAK